MWVCVVVYGLSIALDKAFVVYPCIIFGLYCPVLKLAKKEDMLQIDENALRYRVLKTTIWNERKFKMNKQYFNIAFWLRYEILVWIVDLSFCLCIMQYSLFSLRFILFDSSSGICGELWFHVSTHNVIYHLKYESTFELWHLFYILFSVAALSMFCFPFKF